ncbi:hypothetical protein LguiB_006053 [Lonicera macranthoides]
MKPTNVGSIRSVSKWAPSESVILTAEGERQNLINIAEGKRTSMISLKLKA